jgi:hypothetical protein
MKFILKHTFQQTYVCGLYWIEIRIQMGKYAPREKLNKILQTEI